MKNRVLKDEMNKIIDFASSCRHVYIYGAGNFGRGYLDILQYQGKDANGFIVTEKHGSEYMKKPIYSVDEISSLISTEDGSYLLLQIQVFRKSRDDSKTYTPEYWSLIIR